MDNIRFSVIIILYNQEDYIAECIESVINQTYEPYEIIIVNDGSTDESFLVAESYQLKYPDMVRVFSQENKGAFLARAAGMKQVRGDYFLIMDSDDCLRRDALAVLNREIQKTSADMVVYTISRSKNCDEGMQHYDDLISMEDPRGRVNIQLYRADICRDGRFNSMCTKCIRTACIEGKELDVYAAGLEMGEDKIHSLLTADCVNAVTITNEPLYFYRLNPSSRTNNFRLRDYDDHKRMLQITEQFANKWFGQEETQKMLLQNKYSVICYCVSGTMHKCKSWRDVLQALKVFVADDYWDESLREVITGVKKKSKEMVLLKVLYQRNYAGVLLYYLLLKAKIFASKRKRAVKKVLLRKEV